MGAMQVLVRVEGLSKTFENGPRAVQVLRGLEIEVKLAEKVVIVGESGTGKSTFLHILGALERPSGGRVMFDGTDVFALPDSDLARFRNREIGFVFQFHHLLADFSALENVMMPMLIHGSGWEDARRRALDVLERVGLSERIDHRPGELSGGEQQRVAVGRAVVLRPRLILADEPTGNLDRATGNGIHDLLMELNRDHGMTIIIVTHNERLVGLADRLLLMSDGALHPEAVGDTPVAGGRVP